MMSAGLDQDSITKNKTLQEKFKEKLRTIFQTLSETRAGQKGFFWDYYAPYFIELNEKGFLETFSRIALISSSDPDISTWVQLHSIEVKDFLTWSKGFVWYSDKAKH